MNYMMHCIYKLAGRRWESLSICNCGLLFGSIDCLLFCSVLLFILISESLRNDSLCNCVPVKTNYFWLRRRTRSRDAMVKHKLLTFKPSKLQLFTENQIRLKIK